MQLENLSLKIVSPVVSPSAANFRPPNWPPPPDWAPVLDSQGHPVCYYKDSIWPLRSWSGQSGRAKQLNFGDGGKSKTAPIARDNADLLRLLMTWRIWGPRGARTIGSIKNAYDPLRSIMVLCSQEGICASELMRFPTVVDQIAARIPSSKYSYVIGLLHDLYDARDSLGFVLLDREGISRLVAATPIHSKEQTPYIPPRIWAYQVTRLRSFLDDFLEHRQQIEECFGFAWEAYAHNFGSHSSAFTKKGKTTVLPFQDPEVTRVNGIRKGLVIHGPFAFTEARFGLGELFDRWLGKDDGRRTLGIVRLTQFLSLASLVGLKYLLNFSLMRVNEAWNLRADCLLVEKDEKLGDVYMLRGETTKTDPDSDARWPVSSSTSVAVSVMSVIARLRMLCARHNPLLDLSEEEITNPFLLGPAHEPWSNDGGRGKARKQIRQSYQSYAVYLGKFPHLFDREVLKITEQDLQTARLIEPSLNESEFAVGLVWPLAFHQLRRTSAVNMLSSGMVSESSLQHQLKHLSRAMTLYYGHNYARLSLDPETRGVYLRTMYEALARELANIVSPRFVSPHGESRKLQIVALISESDSKKLESAGRKGEISARQIRLGFCMKRSACTYGGIESIAHCGGGDTGTPCMDVLYDKEQEKKILQYEQDLNNRLQTTPANSPRHNSLQAEKRSTENYYDVIHQPER
ncbi:Integrase [Comamonas aquatilis]